MEGLLEFISGLEELKNVPKDQIQWMIDRGDVRNLNKGDLLWASGSPIDELRIIIEGKYRGFVVQNGQEREFGLFESGLITGVLPFSRLKEAQGSAVTVEEGSVFFLHKKHFSEMIQTQLELVTAFVHFMTSRVRNFTSFQLQNEKLLSLGKLSAGLAHELNNPASAILRSATTLKEHLRALPENFKSVIKIKMTDEEVDTINNLLFSKIDQGLQDDIGLMERTEREDTIAEWLEDNGVEDGYELAEGLVDFGFVEEDLETIRDAVPNEHFIPIINWIENNLTTEKMVEEIGDASKRIADLIGSIKSYTHMDQTLDKQKVDLHKGIQNTLRMLQHKSQKQNISLELDFDPDLPEIAGFPGELNQVFTNLIDNAYDAMENEASKQLNIKTFRENGSVHIHIKDSGPGIPEEVQTKIFDPFFTTKDVGKGTGLGLDIVKKIVEQHKGRIEFVTSEKGTEFQLILPVSS
ncbi:MAG: ATP-binding protein [Flavobacteriales bacterium]|nr:ATP-binding protein [Flavobacteriales bacterium]